MATAKDAAVIARQHLKDARRAYLAAEQLRLVNNPGMAALRVKAVATRMEVLEPQWEEEVQLILDEATDAYDIDSAIATAQLGWRRESAAKRLWSIISKAGEDTPPGEQPAENKPPALSPLDFLPPPAQEVQSKLVSGEKLAAMEEGAVQKYIGLAEKSSALAGQHSLDTLGLQKTFAWAHPQNMANDLFSVRGSKVVQNMYGEHLGKLTDMIVSATDPRHPKTQSEIRKMIREEWPKLQRYQVERIARTESAAVWTTTSLNAYQANGISQFETIVAHGPSIGIESEDPCDICVDAAADGPYEITSDLPPWHPNCRCEAIPVLEGPDGEPWLPPGEPWAGEDMAICGTPFAKSRKARLLKMGAVLKAAGECLIPAPEPGGSFGGDTFENKKASEIAASASDMAAIATWGEHATTAAKEILDSGSAVRTMRSASGELKGIASWKSSGTEGVVTIMGVATKAGGGRRLVYDIGLVAKDLAMGLRVSEGVSPALMKWLTSAGFKEIDTGAGKFMAMSGTQVEAFFKKVDSVVPIPESVAVAPKPAFEGIDAETLAQQWVGPNGSKISFTLRHPKGGALGGLVTDADRAIASELTPRLDQALASSRLGEEVTLYRGIYDSDAAIGELHAGQLFREESFLSTTSDPSIAREFATKGDQPGVVLEITVPKGTGSMDIEALLKTADAKREKEILLERGLTLRIDSVDMIDGQRWAKATVVPNTGPAGQLPSLYGQDLDVLKPGTAVKSKGNKWMEGALKEYNNSPGSAKRRVAQDLVARVRLMKGWDGNAVKKAYGYSDSAYGATGDESIVAQLVNNWARTSSDQDKRALAIQQAVKEEFGLAIEVFPPQVSATARDQLIKDTMDMMNEPGVRDSLRGFVRAQYELSQEMFKEAGVETLTVYRGMKVDQGTFPQAGLQTVDVTDNPIASWSVRFSVSKKFAKGYNSGAVSVMLRAEVPVELIVGTPLTGFGCLNEYEMVVLNGGKNSAWALVEGVGPRRPRFSSTGEAMGDMPGSHFYLGAESEMTSLIKEVAPKPPPVVRGEGAGVSQVAVAGDDAAKVGKRIASVRHKLKNPTKYGHESWTQAEIDVMEKKIADLEQLRADLKAGKVPGSSPEPVSGPQAEKEVEPFAIEALDPTNPYKSEYVVLDNGEEVSTIKPSIGSNGQVDEWVLDMGDDKESYFDSLDDAMTAA